MSLYHSFVLGLLQGITEFLPISSSGHLVLMEHYLGLSIAPDILLTFDIFLHAGTLCAILLYFWSTWITMVRRPFSRDSNNNPPLLLLLIAGSIPLGIVGILGQDWIEANTRTPLFVSFGFLFTGMFLIVSEWFEHRFAAQEACGWKQALGAGLGQGLAVLPGFSRSGITLASGRLMGLTAHRATEFAFLLGAPALGGALILSLATGKDAFATIGWMPIITGFVASFAAGITVIHVLLMTIRKFGVWPWAVYLFIAASLLIADEMMPLIQGLPALGSAIDVYVMAGILFIALLLESAPFTSLFVPGFAAMTSIAFLLRGTPINIIACIPIGICGMILGNLIGYIPARQARLQVRWSEKADERLTRAQHFFRSWGGPAVILGGWIGPVRPFISIAAGLSGMRVFPYLLYMLISATLYVSVTMIAVAVAGETLAHVIARLFS